MTAVSATCRDGVIREQLICPVSSGYCLTAVDRPAYGGDRATIVIAHGLTGDRVGPAELLSRLSAGLCRELCVRVVRFDFRGSGDSSGDFAAQTFTGMTRDLVELTVRHAQPGRPVISSGISIGGVPAALAACQLSQESAANVAGVVLMSSDLIEGVRFGTTGPTAIRGGEFHLPELFFREREKIQPRTLLTATSMPFLLIYGTEDAKLAAAVPWFTAHGGSVVAVEGDHLFQSHQARRGLLEAWIHFVRPLARPDNEDAT